MSVAGFVLAVGCATAPPAGPRQPELHRQILDERWFAVPTRCGQGPYEIELATLGGRWTEDFDLQVEARTRVRLTGSILLEDEEVARSTRTMGQHSGEAPENQYCLAAPADVAEAMQRPAAPAATSGGSAHVSGAPGVDRPAGPVVALVRAERPPSGGWILVQWTAGEHMEWNAVRPGGLRVRIRLWSDVPNDFEGARIGVTHVVVRPDSDEAYDAWVETRRRWDRDQAAHRAASLTPAEAAAERDRGEKEADKRVSAEIARRAYCRAHTEDMSCLSQSELLAKQIAAGDPPPPPRAEQKPPKPSDNADWRPGYWHRAGNDWIWIAGIWRVPEEDVRAERTVHAPAAPPAPAAETPPVSPAPVTVWTPGFWFWSGSGWVWVAGSWQLPPAPNVRWQPHRWIHRAGVFVFTPGGWIR